MTVGVHQRAANVLRIHRLGIDTYQEPILFMSAECPVCRSEGWEALARVRVAHGEHAIVATLIVVTSDLQRLTPGPPPSDRPAAGSSVRPAHPVGTSAKS